MNIQPQQGDPDVAGPGGGDNPPVEGSQPVNMTRDFLMGVAEATANIAVSCPILAGAKAAAPPPPRRSARSKALKRARASSAPYSTRASRAAPSTSVLAKEGSKVHTVVYSGPYIPWRPDATQFYEAHLMMQGDGCFSAKGHITYLPNNNERRSGNKKWLCTWEHCERVMSSQGEAKAHALGHLDLNTTPIEIYVAARKRSFPMVKHWGTTCANFITFLWLPSGTRTTQLTSWRTLLISFRTGCSELFLTAPHFKVFVVFLFASGLVWLILVIPQSGGLCVVINLLKLVWHPTAWGGFFMNKTFDLDRPPVSWFYV